jgi:cytochrome c peroxidase
MFRSTRRPAGLRARRPSRRGGLARALLAATLVVLAGCGGAGSSGTGDAAGAPAASADAGPLSASARLGKAIFEDTGLSEPAGMACASCHQPALAHASNRMVEPGVVAGRFGARNSPSLRYLKFSPPFTLGRNGPVGGFFRDGRARTLAAQAQGPFLNANEMANPDVATLMAKVARAPYAALFQQVWGASVFADPADAFAKLASSVSAYQQEDPDFAPFSSKFDLWRAGKATLGERERQGLALFNDPAKGNCAACHPSAGPDPVTPPLFTDFSYDALGVPRNPAIPANADPLFFDLGLCGPSRSDLTDPALCGKFKVPTLRNVALTAPYFHNGAIATLRDVVRFYATRDTDPAAWYPMSGGAPLRFDDLPAAWRANVNTTEAPYDRAPGQAPRLTDDEIDRIVDFLMTLTDGYTP